MAVLGPTRAPLPALTSLRFVAALLVFSWHCVPTRQFSATFSLGYIGVGFFFLLSGFILTYTYRTHFANGLTGEAVRSFYAARFARIYPLHVVTMPLMVACLIAYGSDLVWTGHDAGTRALALVAQLFLVQSWFSDPAVHFGGNGPAWSISVEVLFYAAFPPLAWLIARAARGASALGLCAAAASLWLVQVTVLLPQTAVGDDWRFYVFPFARLVDFAVGMLVAFAFVRAQAATRWPLRATSVELLVLAFAGLCIYVSPLLPRVLRFSADLLPAWALLVFVFAFGRGLFSRMLTQPVFVRLGEISFAFYLVHLGVINVVSHTLGWQHPLVVPLAFGLTLGLSFALFHAVEQPMRMRLRALSRGRRSKVAGAPAAAIAAAGGGS